MIHTDGVWQMAERNAYFLACGPWAVEMLVNRMAEGFEGGAPDLWVLIATNDFNPESDRDINMVEALIDGGAKVLLDSGIFWLTNRHKRAHGISMDEALSLHPDQVDDFDWLFNRYVRLHERFGDRLWGIIELDQGGAVRKRETRKRLHDLGIDPIPVYHPFVDGWDYFDELAESYDRMCFGNVVQAKAHVRTRLLHTAYERKRAYPHLWLHLLGYSMNEWLHACPVESCDSSSWLCIIRWAASAKDRAMLKSYGGFPTSLRYRYEQGRDGPGGHRQSALMSSAMWRFNAVNWVEHMNRMEVLLGSDDFR